VRAHGAICDVAAEEGRVAVERADAARATPRAGRERSGT